MSIRQRLSLIVLAVAIPLLLLSFGVVWLLADREWDTSRQAIMYSARSISSAVDAQLGKYIAAAQALSVSPSLMTHDIAGFRMEAERALPGLPKSWVVLADAHGQQVINTAVPAGEVLSSLSEESQAAERRAFENGSIQISNVFIAPVLKIQTVAVGVPIFNSGAPVYYLVIAIELSVFHDLLNSQIMPKGWLAAVVDRSGNIIARSLDHELWVGKPASSTFRALMQWEGLFEIRALEGDALTNANVISPLSGWHVAVAVRNALLEAPIRRTVITTSLVGLALTLLSILLATWAARRITAPIKALKAGARLLQWGEQASFVATGVWEVDHALGAFERASRALLKHSDALKRSEERFRALFENMQDGCAYCQMVFDGQGRAVDFVYLAVNSAFGRLTELENVVGKRVTEVIPGIREAHPELLETYGRVARTGQSERFEIEFKPLTSWLAVTAYCPEPGSFAAVFENISEHKRAEQEIAEVTGRLRATVDTAVDAIIVIDEDGVVKSVNPAVERIFGYPPDEIVGKNVSLLMPEPHRNAHQGYIETYGKTGVAKIIGIGREVEGQHKDGTRFPVDLAIAEWRMEGKRFFTGILRDITARKQAEEHIQFVMRELSHRTKNILAVVQSMASRTGRMSVDFEDFQERFASRIEALARSHDLLTKESWEGVPLEDLVRGQLETFGVDKHLDVRGPNLVLKPDAAQTLGLVLHELATNSSKYGSLSRPDGRVEIGWSIDQGSAESPIFRLHWRERGGPEVSPPSRKGFGHSVMKDIAERAFKGKVELDFSPTGLVWQLTAPAMGCLAKRNGQSKPRDAAVSPARSP